MAKRGAIPPSILTWLAGATLTVLLALFGYVVKLTADVARVSAQVEMINRQMVDVAEMVGELWRARAPARK